MGTIKLDQMVETEQTIGSAEFGQIREIQKKDEQMIINTHIRPSSPPPSQKINKKKLSDLIVDNSREEDIVKTPEPQPQQQIHVMIDDSKHSSTDTTTTTTKEINSFYSKNNYLKPTYLKSLDIDDDIIDCIKSLSANIPQPKLVEPDWTSIQLENDMEIDDVWELPKNNEIETDTSIPPGMDFIEFLSRLDNYQQSVKIYTNSLLTKFIDSDMIPLETSEAILDRSSISIGISSSSLSTTVRASSLPLRSRPKRATTKNINNSMSNMVSSISLRSTSPQISTYEPNTLMEGKDHLIEILKKPYPKIQPRPYLPVRVWQGSNWEDWAQFQVGDVIHIPFTEMEDEIVLKMVSKYAKKRTKNNDSILNDMEVWSNLAIALPGRDVQDCQYRYLDLMDSINDRIFKKTFIVSKENQKKSLPYNYHTLTESQSVNGKVTSITHYSTVWQNLSHESTIGEGSGDTLCVTILPDSKNTRGLQIFAGSLCNDDPTYNVEGNLRVWQSFNNRVTQLKGHSTTIGSGSDVQDLWRTVHDVKLSNNKKLLFSASRDGKTKIWHCESKQLVSTFTYHTDAIFQVAVHEGEKNILATASADGYGAIWKIDDKGQEGTGTECETEMIDTQDCSAECVDFGRGPSKDLVFFGYRGTKEEKKLGWIDAFNIEDGRSLFHIDNMKGAVGCLSISHSGKYILSGNDGRVTGDQMMHLHEAQTGQLILSAKTGHLDVNTVLFSPCDKYIVSGSVANEISIFDIRNPSHPLYEFAHGNEDYTVNGYLAPDSGMGVAGMHWLNSCPVLITGGGDCTVKLWDVAGGNGVLKSYQTSNPINCISVNEDLKVLAAGVSGTQGIVHIWQP
ncbi:unnamed protein product [Cunninghamella echinulata]